MRRWLALLLLVASSAVAQTYPSKPIKIVVPFPAGGIADLYARLIGARLTESWGQPILIENRTGAGGNIGTEAVAKAPADGYTLLIGINGPIATNKYLYKSLAYDPDKDLAPISLLASAPQMLVVAPALGVERLRGFIDYARTHPGRVSYASVGSGSASHLTMELLKGEAKIDLVHVPYRGFPPAVTDMLAGNIQAMFAIVPGVLPHVRAGKMKALAVTALKRSPLAPDVPSVAELGFPQLESLAWIGLLAPAATPREVLERLSMETMRQMQAGDVRDLLGKQGFVVVAGTPAGFQQWIRAESAKWARVIKTSGATAD